MVTAIFADKDGIACKVEVLKEYHFKKSIGYMLRDLTNDAIFTVLKPHTQKENCWILVKDLEK